MAYHIAVVVGSLRRESFNRHLAQAVISLAPADFTFEFIDIGSLPLYSQDYDADYPEAGKKLKERLAAANGLLFVTPEYNRSIPGVLKNAIDVGSRPYGHSVWNGKPSAVVSNSPGAIGGFGAYHHLRQSMVFLNMPTVNQPETYVGGVASLFDENGELANEASREFLTGFAQTFADGIDRHLT